MIDLHLHTTASDGTDSPAELVRVCREAGITTMAVTDHDTTAALPASAGEAERAGIACVPGIEITAAWRGCDVHVLGYFFDPDSPTLKAFLESQLDDRIRRARAVGERLASLGVPIDMEALIARNEGRPVLRPHFAQAMVEAGHVEHEWDAFDRYIGEGQPGYVARQGATPAEVVAIIREAGGDLVDGAPGSDGPGRPHPRTRRRRVGRARGVSHGPLRGRRRPLPCPGSPTRLGRHRRLRLPRISLGAFEWLWQGSVAGRRLCCALSPKRSVVSSQ